MRYKMWLLLSALSIVILAPTYEASATAVYKRIPRSYSGGVYLAHKRLVKKVVAPTAVRSQR